MNQNLYWDKVSENIEFTTPVNFNLFEKYSGKNDIILDFGCGYGRTLSDLYNVGYKRLIGVDTSENMIKRGKMQYPYLDLRCSDLSDISDNGADVVIMFGVLCSTPFEDDLKEIVSSLKRVLKNGGILYINDFLISKDLRNSMKYRKYENKYSKYGIFETENGGILRHFTENEINSLFSDFSLLYFDKSKFKTVNGNIANGFSAVYRLQGRKE